MLCLHIACLNISLPATLLNALTVSYHCHPEAYKDFNDVYIANKLCSPWCVNTQYKSLMECLTFCHDPIYNVVVQHLQHLREHINLCLQSSIVVFKPHPLTVTMVTKVLTIISTYVSVQSIKVYSVPNGHSKECAEEDTKSCSLSQVTAVENLGEQLQFWVGYPQRWDLQSHLSFLCTRRHTQVQTILAYPWIEYHIHHGQHTKLNDGTLFASRRVWKSSSA